MQQFSTSTDDFNYFPTSKELNSSKYRRNNRHRKDIIKRMQKAKEKNDTKYPGFRPVDPIKEGMESSRKFNNDDSSCYQSREDRIWLRPNKCGCHWSLKKNDWYVRHHRDRAKKGINKKANFTYGYIPRPPSYKTKFDIKQIISDEIDDEDTSTETYYRMIFKKINKMALQAGYLTWKWYKNGTFF
jgi:hypothetical protein